MTQQHPIAPSPELVEKWIREANHTESMFAQVAVMGAQWGADQELEECCREIQSVYGGGGRLRAKRRSTMTNLSPAAQAVLDAFTEDNSLHDWKHNHYNTDALAAALRAAADELSYLLPFEDLACIDVADLLAIADELEAQQ